MSRTLNHNDVQGNLKSRSARILWLRLLFSGFAFALLARTLYLQHLSSPRLAKLAQNQFRSKVDRLPIRGQILDRNGEPLALSLRVKSLYLRPQLLKKKLTARKLENLALALSRILGQPLSKILPKMKSDRTFVWVQRQLSEKEEHLVQNLNINWDDLNDGIGLAEESKRFYPHHELAAHILGSVNVDGQGLEGIELYYNQILGGEQTKIQSTKDARGRSLFLDDRGLMAFKDGATIRLTLDKSLQYETEKIVAQAVHEYGAKSGFAIVGEVPSGQILAWALAPTFNPNHPKEGLPEARRNRIVTDLYEPGSTLKPLWAGLAMDQGMSHQARFFCENGQFKVKDRIISEAETHERFGWLTLGEIIQHSSNIGAAKLTLQMGSTKISHGLEKLRWGQRTGIDLPGESAGLSAKRESLLSDLKSPVRLANIGFGQGITFTPLQIFLNYMAIANKGQWIQPQILKGPEHSFPLVSGRVFSEKSTQYLNGMLESVVDEKGTAEAAQLENWTVAGKTGTSQKIDPVTKRYSRSAYMATFAGYAPSENPRVVVLVGLDEPTKAYYAGQTAAPTFQKIAKVALQKLLVPDSPPQKMQLRNRNMQAVQSLALRPQKEAKSLHGKEVSQNAVQGYEVDFNQKRLRLPDFSGKSIREIVRETSTYPVKLQVIGSGILKEQTPKSQDWLEFNTTVQLRFEPL